MTLKRYHASNMMSRIALMSSLDKAPDDVYENRVKDHANSDIWSLHTHWLCERQLLQLGNFNTHQATIAPCGEMDASSYAS